MDSHCRRLTEPEGCTAKEQKIMTEAAEKALYNQGCLAKVDFTIGIPA